MPYSTLLGRNITVKELEKLPTLTQMHFSNLKINVPDTARVYLSRMTKADFDDAPIPAHWPIEFEVYRFGNWLACDPDGYQPMIHIDEKDIVSAASVGLSPDRISYGDTVKLVASYHYGSETYDLVRDDQWTPADHDHAEIYTKQFLADLKVKNEDLCTAFITSDAYPGLKFIANTQAQKKNEGSICKTTNGQFIHIHETEGD